MGKWHVAIKHFLFRLWKYKNTLNPTLIYLFLFFGVLQHAVQMQFMRLASGTINTNQDIPHGHISIMCGFLLCLLNTVKNCKYGPVFHSPSKSRLENREVNSKSTPQCVCLINLHVPIYFCCTLVCRMYFC